MKEYMLMFTLGPVQTFIEQARKTRDLWLGSFLFAKLMEAAMEDIDKQAGKFIFPTKRTVEKNLPDLPNKYIAIFNTLPEAEEAARISETKLKKRWKAICDAVWEAVVKGHADTDATRAIWQRQTNPETLFETYWVIVEGDPKNYGMWVEQTQQALDARKRLRDFTLPYDPDNPEERNEPGEKSSISGERQVLHGKGTSRDEMLNFWKSIAAPLSPKSISKDGTEHLDAIDVVKRFAIKASNYIPDTLFPSTSSIATASFVQRLLGAQLDTPTLRKLETWLDITEDLEKMPADIFPYFVQHKGELKWILQRVLRRDGDCYFPETFTENRLKKDYGFTDDKDTQRKKIAEKAPEALKALLKATDALSIPRPTPYYAVIQMDGDNIGTLIGNVKSREEHRAISEALSEFAREEVPPLVQRKRPGRLVYAGGDDALAFSPLEGLLDFVDQLQKKYCKKIRPCVPEELWQDATARMGIAIAHHYTSLSYVLRTVRDAEKLAKDRYGKNAFVVTVIRRSGEQTRVGCHWRYNGLKEEGQPIKLFSRFYDLFDQDILSPKCVHNLLTEASTLIGLRQEAQQSEIKRVLRRQRDDKKKSQLPDDEVKELAEQVTQLAIAMDEAISDLHKYDKDFEKSVYLHEDKPRYGLVETLGWLLVMAFLARKEGE